MRRNARRAMILKDLTVIEKWHMLGYLVAQSVKHLTLDFSSGLDLRVLGSSPTLQPETVWSLLKN